MQRKKKAQMEKMGATLLRNKLSGPGRQEGSRPPRDMQGDMQDPESMKSMEVAMSSVLAGEFHPPPRGVSRQASAQRFVHTSREQENFRKRMHASGGTSAQRGRSESRGADSRGRQHQSAGSEGEKRGPSRFFYDQSSYTGIHRSMRSLGIENKLSMDDFPRPRQDLRPTTPMRGPERFFYDKSAYTGVHVHGGPSTMGGNGGYQDLKTLTAREHIQNDQLQRKKYGVKI